MRTAKPKPRINGPYRHGRRWRVQISTGSGAARSSSYKTFDNYDDAADLVDVAVARMPETSEGLLRRAKTAASSRDGWVYAVAVHPEASPKRLKVGFTTSLIKRFAQHRTTSPTALPVAAWEASKSDEAVAHKALTGRVGVSEVFLVHHVGDAIASLSAVLGPRVEPMHETLSPRGSRPSLVQKNYATARQRPSKPNGRTAIADLVIRDVRARQEVGARRYGTDLQANNGRDALVDAYQEAIDLAMYLRQLLEERDGKSEAG